MEDDFEEMENLMDDDPALDYILYDEMSQEDNSGGDGGGHGHGCFGVLLLLLLPVVALLPLSFLFR